MSKIGKILYGESDDRAEEDFTEEQESFLKEEGFEWSEYTGWNYNSSKDDYNIWIQAKVGYFSLYIYKGEYQGESECEETYFWVSEEEFEEKYDEMLKKVEEFFEK